MDKNLRFIYISLLIFGLSVHFVKGQTVSEEELKIQAAKLFEEENFEKASLIYSQLLSYYPEEPIYNYRLGVCMLITSGDKEKALQFLENASKKPDVDIDLLYYLGKAYHLNYRFDEAIAQYSAYKKIAPIKNLQKFQVDRQIEMCQNGKNLLHGLTDLVVMEKKEMNREDFFRSYDVSSIGGKLLVKPDEKDFKTELDRKKKEQSIIYLAKDNQQIYFSSYGEEEGHGKDIYRIKKLPNGNWSKAQALGNKVNTKYDEDYPFLHPNGKVLYFCSKGHNSMGGYDIFKTTFDEQTNTWAEPKNMDFPINTPDDDILYVTDSSENEAYFSSARSSAIGKIAVYHINKERKFVDLAIIKGFVIKNRENQVLDITITVKDLNNDMVLGIYNANAETGAYLLVLPNGGKFLYTVESIGFPTQSEIVEGLMQNMTPPTRQEISYDLVTNKMSIKNLYDKDIENNNNPLALSFIKTKSKLDVSKDGGATKPIVPKNNNIVADTTQTTENNSNETKLNNDDIVKIAYKDAKEVNEEADSLREEADIALNFANQKNELAKNKSKEGNALMAEASKTIDVIRKQELIDEANNIYKDAEQLNKETVAAFNLSKKLDIMAANKREEADLSQQYAKGLEAAIKSKNPTVELAKLEEQEKKIEALNQANTITPSVFNSLKMDADLKQRELNKAIKISADIKQEILDNEKAIADSQADADKTRNDKLKQGLNNEIEGLKEENIDKQKELKKNEIKVAKLQKEYDVIVSENQIVDSVIDQSKVETNESASASIASIDKNKLEQQVNSIKNSTTVISSNKTVTNTSTSASVPSVIPVNPAVNKDTAKTVLAVNDTLGKATQSIAKSDNLKQPASILSKDTTITVVPVNDTSGNALTSINTRNAANLAVAEQIEDPAKREIAKSVVLTIWSEEIDANIEKQQQNLANETNPDKKALLAKQISDAEAISKEKDTLANQSIARADSLKQPASIASKDAGNRVATVNDATGKTTQNIVKSEIPKQQPPVATIRTIKTATPTNDTIGKALIAINAKNAANLASAEQIGNPVDRETAKSEVLKKWSEEINANVVKQQQGLAKETNPQKKALLAKQISDAQAVSKEKNTLATQSMVRVDSLKQQASLANRKTNNTVITTGADTSTSEKALADINTRNAANLSIAEQIDDPAKREAAKSVVLTIWSEEIDANIEKQQQDLANETNPDKKALLAKQISDAEAISKEKNTLANQSMAIADSLKQPASVASKGASNRAVTVNDATGKTTPSSVVKSEIPKQQPPVATIRTIKTGIPANDTSGKALTAINTRNAENLAVAEQMEDPVKREAAKSAIFKKWSEEINANVAKQQQELTNETNPQKKALLAKRISHAKEVSKEKNTLAIQSKAKADRLKHQTTSLAVKNTDEKTIIFNDTTKRPLAATNTENTSNAVTGKNNVKSDSVKKKPVAYKDTHKFIWAENQLNLTSQQRVFKTPKVAATPKNLVAVTPKNSPESVVISKEEFDYKLYSVYSDEHPIPIDEKMPEGLVIKVQIGAFSKPIPQDLFLGMSPITGETNSKGYTCYRAGKFKKFAPTIIIRDRIKEMGYKDAFIVAYFNGKRISINEAYSITGETPPSTLQASANTTSNNLSTNKANSNYQPTPVITQTSTSNSMGNSANNLSAEKAGTNNQQTDVAKAENISAMGNGLFYTVQIGVVAQAVSADKLHNVQPLYTETAPNGFLRYNTGIFNNIPRAVEAKNRLVDIGIKDAFVTAYYKGKRISITEAKLHEQEGSKVFSTAPNVNEFPVAAAVQKQNSTINTSNSGVQQSLNKEQPAIANSTIKQPNNSEMVVDSSVVFKVQVGAFKNEVPLETANKFINMANKGIESYKDNRGLTIYTIGNFKSFDEANKLRLEIVSENLNGAFIVAYRNGKRISMEGLKK